MQIQAGDLIKRMIDEGHIIRKPHGKPQEFT